MKLAGNIARLRALKNVTQEQVAHSLGVSAPAVSKWESGKSCPDIALLAPLSRYFGVSVDQLLGCETELSEASIDELAIECAHTFTDEGWAAGLEHVKAIDRAYPEHFALEFRLACVVQDHFVFVPDDAGIEAAHAYQRDLLTRAAETSDARINRLARFVLATILATSGETAEARRILTDLSDEDAIQPQQMLPTLHLIEKDYPSASKLAQQMLLSAIGEAIHLMITLTAAAAHSGDHERARAYATAQEALAGIFGLMPIYGATVAQTLNSYAAAAGDAAALLRGVKMFAGWLLGDENPRPDGTLFCDVDLKSESRPQHRAAMVRGYLDELTNSATYRALHEDEEFQAVQRSLSNALTKD